MKSTAKKALQDVKNIETRDKQKEKEMSKRMIQGKKEKSTKQVVIEGNEAEIKKTEVVQQTFLGIVWSWVMFFMWLPLAIPIRFVKFWFDIAITIFKTLLPYLVSVWKLYGLTQN